MKKLTMTILTFLLIVSLFGCANPQQKAVDDAMRGHEDIITDLDSISSDKADGSGETSEADSDSKGSLKEYFEGYPAAKSILPEPWMAYPDSIVDIDWVKRGLSEFPAWTLVAPPGTTREDVVDYYISLAEQRDDFETVETYHGIAGVWAWNGKNITIEPDGHYDHSELVQIGFWFQAD